MARNTYVYIYVASPNKMDGAWSIFEGWLIGSETENYLCTALIKFLAIHMYL